MQEDFADSPLTSSKPESPQEKARAAKQSELEAPIVTAMNRSSTRRAIGFLLALGGLGCASGQPSSSRYVEVEELATIAWFEDYSTVLSGTYAQTHHLFPRAIDLVSEKRSMRCSGAAPLLEVPVDANPPLACDGMTGVAELFCSDERLLRLRWTMDPNCRSGFGQGSDRDGNRVLFVFGGSPDRVRTAFGEAVRNQSTKPELPAFGSTAKAGIGTGTAFFVSWTGHLITNYHVIEGGGRIQVALEDGAFVDARVVREDRENDLALLEVDAFRTPLLIREAQDLARGASVAALGYPLIPLQGRDQKATIGHINALSGIQGDKRFAQLSAPIQPGNSGGPLLNESGEVVGVVSSMLSPTATFQAAGVLPQNVNYAVKSSIVHQLVQRALGEEWAPQEEIFERREWPEVISRVEDSVVLVVVEPSE